MPKNQFQRMVFAFLTVLITVHAYVFFSLYVVNGNTLMAVNQKTSVLSAIQHQGGVYIFAHYLPIWSIILVEFCLAFTLEIIIGSPYSFKIACKIADPSTSSPLVFETAIICSTVLIMCPAMSFLAALMYYPYYLGFNVFTLIANWLKLMCFNLPFAFFTQIFFIQPFVRTVFRLIFCRENTLSEKITEDRTVSV